MQANLSTLKKQIGETQSQLQELRSDKAVSELRLTRLEADLEMLKSAQEKNKNELHKIGRLLVGVEALQDQANALISDAEALEAGLQDIKHTLTQCAASLSSVSSQLVIHDSAIAGVMRRRGLKRTQQTRDFNRDKVVIAKVMTALSNMKMALPVLLKGTEIRFLRDASESRRIFEIEGSSDDSE